MIAVFTALIGSAESAPRPGPASPGVRYICYTDRTAPGWECRPPVAGLSHDPRKAARWAKTHVHEIDVDVSIWIDASFDLVVPPAEIIACAGGAEIAAFGHPDRDCVRDEAREIIRCGMAPFDLVEHQVEAYRIAGFPTDTAIGLTTTGLMVRRHTEDVALFNALWWHEIAFHTARDQLSVDYAAWRAGVTIARLPGNYRENRFARYNRQRHRQGRVAA